MNRIYKTNFIKRSLLVGMAVVTFFTSLAAPAKAAFADTYDDYYEDYDEPIILYEDIPEYDAPITYGDDINW